MQHAINKMKYISGGLWMNFWTGESSDYWASHSGIDYIKRLNWYVGLAPNTRELMTKSKYFPTRRP